MAQEHTQRLLQIMFALSIIGLLVAGYQTYEHYFLSSGVCDFSSTFSCSLVTESRFGEFPPNSGIATAGFGMLWWIALMYLLYREYSGSGSQTLPFYLWAWLLAGIVFMLYLLTVEFYILPQETGQLAICPFCTIQHILMLILFIMSFFILRKPVSQYLIEVFYTEAKS